MRIWLRLLIIWLTALALPVQGLAAAAMVHCGPSHERMHAPVAQAGQEHHPLQGQPQAHAAEPADDLSAQGHPSHASHSSHSSQQLGQHTCGSCAACCVGLALLCHMPQAPQGAPAAATFAVNVLVIADVAQPGPDRPPRGTLA